MLKSNRRHSIQRIAGGLLSLGSLAASCRADTTGQEKIKIGQIGVGHAHANKLAVYRESPDYEVVGIVEPDPQLRQAARQQPTFRDLPWMSEEQLLNVPGLQAVLIETQVKDLLDTAERALQAGKHLHLDKPAGQSLPQFRRILDMAARQQLLVQMGYMYRYNPGVILLREFLEQGWLGEVFEVHAVMSKVVQDDDRQRLAEYPGGMMFELGCHLLDLVIGILGEPDQVTAYGQHAGASQDALLDNMLAVLSYPKALATVKSSALEVDGFSRRHLVVCGSEGTLQIQPLDRPEVLLTLSAARESYDQGAQRIRFPPYQRYVADAADMAKIIRSQKESDYSYAHDLLVQETVLRACNLPLN
ncbi:MAG: Gfo/Idh/MocA family oxidoreductase [bacterium]|nr:Gfo/Idh/MocA family oxidoreductase [bacterium]